MKLIVELQKVFSGPINFRVDANEVAHGRKS
ncbi:hypothetical protein J2809_004173 [Arthrobacter pascens]|nr:hypothetical protein [Arthrobacter pascens]